MFSTTYIDDLIADGEDAEISYRNLHPPVQICDAKTGVNISVPYMSLTNKYKDYLEPITIKIQLKDFETLRYRYKPKTLSHKLYGTTELWAGLLELNHMVSVIEFVPTEIVVYDPHKIKAMINEILIMEGILK